MDWLRNSFWLKLAIIFMAFGLIPLLIVTGLSYYYIGVIADGLPIVAWRNFILNIGLAAVVAVTVVSVVIARLLSQPTATLATISQQIVDGDWQGTDQPYLSALLTFHAKDEMAQLIGNILHLGEQWQQQSALIDERVQARTQGLQTSAEMSRQITTMLNLDELLTYVVARLESQFDYHVQIYLLDETDDYLTLATPHAEKGYLPGAKIALGQGVVGTVAQTGQQHLLDDSENHPDFVYQPSLPNMHSQLALPLRKGETVLGVLDLQSQQLNGFTPDMIILLQSIADQLAVAVDNARLFQKTKTALNTVEALNRRLTSDAWQDIGGKIQTTGFMADKNGLKPDTSAWLPAMTEAVKELNLVTAQHPVSLAIPLTLREEVIGVLGIERSNGVPWTDDEIVTIRTMAEQVALALDAARLARETQRRAAREEIIANLTQTVWSANNIEDVLRNSVSQLGPTFKASKVMLQLAHQPESGTGTTV